MSPVRPTQGRVRPRGAVVRPRWPGALALALGLGLLLAPVSPVDARDAGAAGERTPHERAPVRQVEAIVTRISDGDTLWWRPVEGGKPQRLRLVGLDAPERCQPGGRESREWLRRAVWHERVTLEIVGRDQHGRPLGRVRLRGRDVGAEMVAQGWAWDGAWRGRRGPYAAEELAARAARRGVFQQADPERPRAFRDRHGPCEADPAWR
jgi:endonuclease YncB( thermonuclease family)